MTFTETAHPTRREALKTFAVALPVVGVALIQTGCSTDQLTADLLLIETAASAAIDVAFPSVGALLAPYFTEVTNFIDQATTELASGDSAAIKATKIAQYALQIALPSLPPGTVSSIVFKVIAVGTAITMFLEDIKGLGVLAARQGAKAVVIPSQKELAKVRAGNVKLQAKLAAAPRS